jgi:hypothetical protein
MFLSSLQKKKLSFHQTRCALDYTACQNKIILGNIYASKDITEIRRVYPLLPELEY